MNHLKNTYQRKIIEEFLNESTNKSVMGMNLKISPLVNEQVIIIHPKNFPNFIHDFEIMYKSNIELTSFDKDYMYV